jgi:hypothetical protein
MQIFNNKLKMMRDTRKKKQVAFYLSDSQCLEFMFPWLSEEKKTNGNAKKLER